MEPALPSPRTISPSRRTTVGAIIDGTRRPGAIRWKPSGLRSSSPSMLLRITPVPGTSTPEPEPFEQVTLAQVPSASITAMWVVEPSRSARWSLAASIAATSCSGPLLGPSRSSRPRQ